jgi:signal transduction histidine kinase
MREPGPSRLATAGYSVLFVVCVVVSVGLLAVGAVVLVADNAPGFAAALAGAAAEGDSWARGVLAATPPSEPLGQAAMDYSFSLLNLVIAAMLLASRVQGWPIRLLVIAMVASAGAFNLQVHPGGIALQTATALPVAGLRHVLLGVACAAFLLALLLFPPGRILRPGSALRKILISVAVSALLLVTERAGLVPQTVGGALFFGFLVPLVVLASLPRRWIHHGITMEQRSQTRVLFTVLAAVVAVAAVLGVVTLLAWRLGWLPVSTLVDPTAQRSDGTGEPTALLFWFARFASAAIAAAVLVATRRTGLWTAEQVLSVGLATTVVVALVGGGFVVIEAMGGALISVDVLGGFLTVTVLVTTLEALSFLSVHGRAERLVDRVLYGTRPAPYSVLAGIAALSRSKPRDGPNLARVAEAVARGLGAMTCRLTVARPGLRDRIYSWAEPGTDPDIEDVLEVPVYHGEERIGSIAVDRGAVVGLYAQRRQLLMDIADSLGVVMQASRAGVELERQLRAVLAHAEDIAVSRRKAVSEMDSERRRIERDLHDGAQHRLVSLRLTLGLAEHQVATAQYDQARDRLDQIAEQIESAEEVLAATARGVSSPLLSERGLVAALELELSGAIPPVVLDVGGLDVDRRFPAQVEAAVYFCCLESVNNASKHAPGAAVAVHLATIGDKLCFSVRDDGPGFDLAAGPHSPGRGLRNVQARMAAVGGRIEMLSRPGAGTAVEGLVPLPADSSRPSGPRRFGRGEGDRPFPTELPVEPDTYPVTRADSR